MSKKISVKKALKLLLVVIVSPIMFLVFAMIIDLLAKAIFGTTTISNGVEQVNMNGGVLIAITALLTLGFSVWFFKLLTNYKIEKAEE